MTDSNSLTVEEVETLCLKIRLSKLRQLERIQAFMDGATLAAEQVQDVRISLQEQGSDSILLGLVVPFIVTFVLESNAAGLIVSSVADRIIEPVIKTSKRLAAIESTLVNTGTRLAQESRTVADGLLKMDLKEVEAIQMKVSSAASVPEFAREKRLIASQLTPAAVARRAEEMALRAKRYERDAINWRILSEVSVKLTNAVESTSKAPETSVAILKGVKEVYSFDPDTMASEPSPGVSLLASIQDWGAKYRFLVAYLHECAEATVRSGKITVNQANQLLLELDRGGLGENLGEIRHSIRLLYEAAIWSTLYSTKLMETSIGATAKNELVNAFDARALAEYKPSKSPFVMLDIPQSLVSYWVNTFETVAHEAFVRSLKLKTDPRDKATPNQKEFEILWFFWQVQDQLSKLLKKEMAPSTTK